MPTLNEKQKNEITQLPLCGDHTVTANVTNPTD